MSSENWRDTWDTYAEAEYKQYNKKPVAQLMADLKAGKFGEYHMIWRSIAERATLAEVGWDLYAFLESEHDYLHRYHCAAALLRQLDSDAFEPVELAAKRGDQLAVNLKKLAQLLETRIGPRPSHTQR